MKKMSGKIKVILILFVVLFLGVSGLRFYFAYNEYVEEFKEVVYPSMDEGFTIRNVHFNSEIEIKDNFSDVYLSLKPGESYKGSVIVKNHNSFKDEYRLVDNKFRLVVEEGEEPAKGQTSLIDFEKDVLTLGPKEYQIYNYLLTVPEDFEYGNYLGGVKVYPIAQELVEAPTKVITAAGIRINLEVTDSPKGYEYEYLLSDPFELAENKIFNEARVFGAVILAIFALAFLFKGLKYNKNNS